jgi:hypothetical protein
MRRMAGRGMGRRVGGVRRRWMRERRVGPVIAGEREEWAEQRSSSRRVRARA